MTTTVLNPFKLDLDAHSLEHSISFPDESRTIQADAEQSDINTIVRQFGITHELPYGLQTPVYEDFTDAPTDYHAAMNFITAADNAFMEMPAEIRSEFKNDAGLFLDFVSKPDNYTRASELGLVPPSLSTDDGIATPASDTPPDVAP